MVTFSRIVLLLATLFRSRLIYLTVLFGNGGMHLHFPYACYTDVLRLETNES